MSEPLRQDAETLPLERIVEAQVLLRDPLLDLLPEIRPAETNDNEVIATPREGERIGFQVPAVIWRTMVMCYALFLAALLAATGGTKAAFAIVISALYVAVFFGTARLLVRQQPQQPTSPLEKPGGRISTLYGPMDRTEVAVQMLVVPCCVVLFGVAIMVVRLVVA